MSINQQISEELWATKFSVPTVAHGYVYVGTQSNNTNTPGMGTLYIFCPLTRSGC